MSKINDLEREVKADVKEATEAVSAENANKPWFKRLSLTTWIFIALALGVVAGLALQAPLISPPPTSSPWAPSS